MTVKRCLAVLATVALLSAAMAAGQSQCCLPGIELGLQFGASSPLFLEGTLGLRLANFSLGLAMAEINRQPLSGFYGGIGIPLGSFWMNVIEGKTLAGENAEWAEVKIRIPLRPWFHSGIGGCFYVGGRFSVLSIDIAGKHHYSEWKGLVLGKELFILSCPALPYQPPQRSVIQAYLELQFLMESLSCQGCANLQPHLEAGIRCSF